jgi:hypothetical protein
VFNKGEPGLERIKAKHCLAFFGSSLKSGAVDLF